MSIIITGGICTGKSTVCTILKEFGYHIIDADKIAHDKLDENTSKIADMFGKKFIVKDKVDRKKLSSIIFSNPKNKKILEDFLHPLIRKEIKRQEKDAIKKDKKFIIDIPLFFETNSYEADKIILVYAPKELQIKRLLKRDGFSKDEAILRIKSQMDIEKKRDLSDIIIDNTKDITNLKKEIKKVVNADFKI